MLKNVNNNNNIQIIFIKIKIYNITEKNYRSLINLTD